jgi:hypothetical protein
MAVCNVETSLQNQQILESGGIIYMWSKVDYPDIFLSMWEITKKKLMMRA